jgi:solute carrier family 13 (sodium-dependent dicarboxylate transporter), member 2/3/5
LVDSLEENGPMPRIRLLALASGLAVFFIMLALPAPTGLEEVGWRTAAVATLMAIWWMTEALPIPATAMLPLVLFPILGILDMPAAAAPYANEVIFLFLGGFILAAGMQRWGLHKRLALGIMAFVGATPKRLLFGFMAATAFLSMWISNTATAAMMLPIALAVAELFSPRVDGKDTSNFPVALLLGIAYAASIGGVATLIGTPPNAVLAAASAELIGVEISFVEWMAVGVPTTLVFLPIAWGMLLFMYPPEPLAGDAAGILANERASLGRMGRGEKIVAVVFFLTAVSWVFRAPLDLGFVSLPGLQTLFPGIRDSTIAMAAAVALFVIPVYPSKGIQTISWRETESVPWGVLLLFGGGLSLALAMDRSGLAGWIGQGVVGLEGVSVLVLVAAVATLFIFLTEITSNTATSTMAMPLMVGVAVALGVDAVTLMATAALASSMAFMLPVATPPNAIVFGSERITIQQMARAGFFMNLISIVIVTIFVFTLVPRVFPD